MEYGLEDAFNIDNGELDAISKQKCFTLGIEWAMIKELLFKKKPFSQPFHSDNYERVKILANKYAKEWTIEYHDDWPLLTITLFS